jgi:hypothetical protein
MENSSNPLVSFAELLKRLAEQLPPAPWQAIDLNAQRPLIQGVVEPPPPPKPEKPHIGIY